MSTLLDDVEFAKLLRKSKQEPVNFAFGLGKKPENHVLAFHLRKEGKPLFVMLKGEGEGITKGTWGHAESDSKSITLTVEKEIPGLYRNVKLCLKAKGIKLKPVIIGASGEILKDADDKRDDLKETLEKLTAAVKKAIRDDPSRESELMEALTYAEALLERGTFDRAEKQLKKLDKLLVGRRTRGNRRESTDPEPRGRRSRSREDGNEIQNVLNATVKKLATSVQKVIKEDPAQRDKLVELLSRARSMMDDGAYDRANQVLKELAKLLKGRRPRRTPT